jgi:hypothetical protein
VAVKRLAIIAASLVALIAPSSTSATIYAPGCDEYTTGKPSVTDHIGVAVIARCSFPFTVDVSLRYKHGTRWHALPLRTLGPYPADTEPFIGEQWTSLPVTPPCLYPWRATIIIRDTAGNRIVRQTGETYDVRDYDGTVPGWCDGDA